MLPGPIFLCAGEAIILEAPESLFLRNFVFSKTPRTGTLVCGYLCICEGRKEEWGAKPEKRERMIDRNSWEEVETHAQK